MFDTRSEGKLGGDGGASQAQQNGTYSPRTVPGIEEIGNVSENGTPNAGLRDLIQFFKKTPPPPNNFMSIPDNFSTSSEEDKWDKFKTKVFRRRSSKSRKHRPPLTMLPDSAVSSRTTDGHRYIAISIPTEHSHLAPLPNSQYPIYDSVEAAFHREVNSRFGMWKNAPTNRPVTVLNPVLEERRESMSASSVLSTASERPGQSIVIPGRAMRARPHSVSLVPSREQRYIPRKERDLVKVRSAGDAPPAPQSSEPTTTPQSSERQRDPMPRTTEMNALGPSRQHSSGKAPTRATDVRRSSIVRVIEKPVITLTLPQRTSSKRGKTLEPVSPEKTEQIFNPGRGSIVSIDDAYGNGNGNGHLGGLSSGRAPRGSFAASIETTNSSPQILKAQTAIAFHSVPIIVRSANSDVESPLDLNFPQPPLGQGVANPTAARTSLVGPPPPFLPVVERSHSRKEKVREKKQRDVENKRAQMEDEGKGKGKEPALQAFGSTLTNTMIDHDDHDESEDNSSASLFSSISSSSSSDLPPRKWSESTPSHDASHDAPPQKAPQRREREARYIARALAERRSTLEHLPRDELVRRYEALREQRVYERERRLRRLERGRDAWARAVPALLRDLNGVLREQQRILALAGLGLGLTQTRDHNDDDHHAFPTPAASSQYRREHHHHHHHRRRSRSAEASFRSRPSEGSLDPLETRRRSRSLQSGGSRSGRRSSSWHSG
ncbi:hypothetical protein GGS24DRAFT_509902 [Hypoxylon argillaceum]|nr:hypothetical protein GGS24DRAFT_509902 [Hypoxylon argillaceum]